MFKLPFMAKMVFGKEGCVIAVPNSSIMVKLTITNFTQFTLFLFVYLANLYGSPPHKK